MNKQQAIIHNSTVKKVFTAQVFQSGTDAPTLIVQENTLGFDFPTQYGSIGVYYLNPDTFIFTPSRTNIRLYTNHLVIGGISTEAVGAELYFNNAQIILHSGYRDTDGIFVPSDDVLNGNILKIELY